MQLMEKIIIGFADAAWGPWLLVLLLGGGAFFLCYSRFLPFRFVRHAIDILRGKYDDASDPGDISHFAALSSALAATIGVGNIAGVAVAVTVGGPGAIFWMWLSAVVGWQRSSSPVPLPSCIEEQTVGAQHRADLCMQL